MSTDEMIGQFRRLQDGPFRIDFDADGSFSVTWWQHHPAEPWYRWGRTTDGAHESIGDALREAVEIIREARS